MPAPPEPSEPEEPAGTGVVSTNTSYSITAVLLLPAAANVGAAISAIAASFTTVFILVPQLKNW